MIDWQNVFNAHLNANSENINNCMECFVNVLNDDMNLFVPIKEVFEGSSNSRASVKKYPLYIRQLFRKKVAAWRLYKRYKTDQVKTKYKAAEAKFSSAVYAFNDAKENELIKNGNIGSFYNYVNNKLVTKTGVSALKDSNGILVHEDADKARVLSETYGKMYSVDNGIIPEFPARISDDVEINSIDFNRSTVYRHLRKLKPKTSSGPDGLSAAFLRNLAPSLSLPLSILFHNSFNAGDLPDIWKMAIITPIFKKGGSPTSRSDTAMF